MSNLMVAALTALCMILIIATVMMFGVRWAVKAEDKFLDKFLQGVWTSDPVIAKASGLEDIVLFVSDGGLKPSVLMLVGGDKASDVYIGPVKVMAALSPSWKERSAGSLSLLTASATITPTDGGKGPGPWPGKLTLTIDVTAGSMVVATAGKNVVLAVLYKNALESALALSGPAAVEAQLPAE